MGSFSKLQKIISEGDNFLIVCHEHADGDSVGALLALGEFLESKEKNVTLVSKDPVPEVFRFLKGSEKIKHDFLLGNHDVVISVDNGDCRRTGFPDRLGNLKPMCIPLVNVDHHPKNDLWKMASINYVDPDASSACEVIYGILTAMDYPITSTMATALLTGIYTDTGGFQHSNTSPEVLGITSDLLKRGAKLKKITENIANSRSVSMLKLWGIALDRIAVVGDYDLVYSILTQGDMERAGATEQEVAGVVNLLSSIPNTRVALLLYETHDGKIKGSLRTESDSVDLSEIAASFGGGGHKKASGFSVQGSFTCLQGVWKIV